LVPFLEQETEKSISLESVMSFSEKGIVIDRKEFEKKRKQEKISFDEGTGEIKIEGQYAGTLKFNSSQYFFFLCLWKKKNKWMSHQDILLFVKELEGKERKATAQEFCNTQRNRIIKQIPELKNFLDYQNLKTRVNQCILRV
jgi:hypothetical protein